MPTRISANDLPALYHAADQSSLHSQRVFLFATKSRLAGLLGAAFFGLFVWTSQQSPTDWAGVLAAICFFVAVLVEVYVLAYKPERTWYEGRAAAESVKTLSWRYMMGAAPFERQSVSVDQLFLRQLDEVLLVLKELDLSVAGIGQQQITDAMRSARASSLDDRKATYELDRVADQQSWYSQAASRNRRLANSWAIFMLLAEIVGVVASVFKAVGAVRGDFLGFASAIVAAMAAWLQAKQHRTLATAYGVTVLELASMRSRISSQQTDDDWSIFVTDAEEAFSREHTLWKASRGVQSL